MNALEILLAESQERMCYEVRPGDVEAVRAVADRFDLGCSVIGEVTDDRYVCTFDDGSGDRETVVDAPAEFLADGAPTNDLDRGDLSTHERDRPDVTLADAFETVVGHPNTASKRWVYRQYDHEVGVRTAVRPGDDAALLAIREAPAAVDGVTDDGVAGDADASGDGAPLGTGLALAAGAEPNWTAHSPYEGARSCAVEVASNLAVTGARPLAAVDCLNGGNPEKPSVYGGFAAAVDGLADACAALDVPVVGGNVSLYNDSAAGPVPPTPTLAMVGTRAGYDAPPAALSGEGELLLVGGTATDLGGSQLLASAGGDDRFPAVPGDPAARIDALARVAGLDATLAAHDASHGGLAVTLAEMVTDDAGADVGIEADDPLGALFCEQPGRAVVETTDPEAVRRAAGDVPVERLGPATGDGQLDVAAGDRALAVDAGAIRDLRSVIGRELD